jgi:hypothetical protein
LYIKEEPSFFPSFLPEKCLRANIKRRLLTHQRSFVAIRLTRALVFAKPQQRVFEIAAAFTKTNSLVKRMAPFEGRVSKNFRLLFARSNTS